MARMIENCDKINYFKILNNVLKSMKCQWFCDSKQIFSVVLFFT